MAKNVEVIQKTPTDSEICWSLLLFSFKYPRAVDKHYERADVVEYRTEEGRDHAEERKSDHCKADQYRENEILINDLSRLLGELDDEGNVLREKVKDYIQEFQKEKRTPDIAKHLIGYTSPDGEGKSGLEKLFDKDLKEFIGHTKIEVTVGCILGIFIAICYYVIIPSLMGAL